MRAFTAPVEMLWPSVAARVEQPDLRTRLRIARPRTSSLELITKRAAQTKVFKLGSPACASWEDVVKVKGC